MLCAPMTPVYSDLSSRVSPGAVADAIIAGRGWHRMPSSPAVPGGERQGLDDIGAAWQAAGPALDLPVRSEHEHGGGPADVQSSRQVQAGCHVDVNMRDILAAVGHVREQLPGRPARSAERGGELQQCAPLPEWPAQVGFREPLARRLPEPAVTPEPAKANHARRGQDRRNQDQSGNHARLERPQALPHSRWHPQRPIPAPSASRPGRHSQAGLTWATTRPAAVSSKLRSPESVSDVDAGYQTGPFW